MINIENKIEQVICRNAVNGTLENIDISSMCKELYALFKELPHPVIAESSCKDGEVERVAEAICIAMGPLNAGIPSDYFLHYAKAAITALRNQPDNQTRREG